MQDWWVHKLYYGDGPVMLAAWVFWVIFSITLHELGHGWAAIRQGDETPRETGHMTWNPLVHMGPWSLAMFALIGIAWGLMPTDPSRYRSGRRGRVIVALAGPFVNVVLAFICLTALGLWLRFGATGSPFDVKLVTFLSTGGMLNVLLAGFNLLPIPPLDGSQVLMGLSWRAYRWYGNPIVRQYAFFGILALFFIFRLGTYAFLWANQVSLAYLGLMRLILGAPGATG